MAKRVLNIKNEIENKKTMKPLNLLLIAFSLILLMSLTSANVGITATNNSVGVIRSDFYGANTGGRFIGGDSATYGTTNGTAGVYLNVTNYKNAWTDLNLNMRRYDMLINTYYSNQTSGWTDGINRTGDTRQLADDVEWAYNNSQKILLIANKMPSWLADTSNPYGDCHSDTRSCTPLNYTIWGNLVVDELKNITNNGQYLSAIYGIEGWNEPEVPTYLLVNLTSTDANSVNRSLAYISIYNATYNAVKAYNSSIKVGGHGNLLWALQYQKFWLYATGNLSNITDFVTWHRYDTNLANNLLADRIITDYNNICGNYTALIGYCPPVITSEFNSVNATIMNNTNYPEYKSEISNVYSSVLNTNPYNWSLIFYEFAENTKYTSGVRFNMFSDTGVDNWKSLAYNATKAFTNNHRAGNTVYSSSSTDSGIKSVVSKNSTNTFVTLINTNATAQTVSLNLTALGTTGYLKDYETGQAYNLNTPITLQSNDVKTMYSVEGSPLTITNSPSGNITIAGHTAEINSTIDSVNPLDTVQTNLSGVVTNIKDPSLILCYNFDNRSSLGENDTYVVDWCGGNNGTVVGGSNVSMTSSGKYNGAFNGTGNIGYVNASNLHINYSNDLSVSLFIKPYFLNGTLSTLFADSLDGSNKDLVVQVNNTHIQVQFAGTSCANVNFVYANSLDLNVWTHLSIVINKTANTLRVYKNGTSLGAVSISSVSGVCGTPSLFVIGSLRGTSAFFNGSIDEVRIFNKTLSGTEALSISTSSLNKFNTIQYNFYNDQNIVNLSNVYTLFVNDTLCNNNSASNNVYRKQTMTLTSTPKGIVNSIFYGVNYNTNGGGLSSADSHNSTTAFLYSKFKILRMSIFLENKVNSDMSIKTGTVVTQDRDTIAFAHNNGIKVQLIAKNMPTFTMNQSSPLCSNSGASCPSIDGNYSLFAQTVVAYITNMTNGGLWNETIDSVEIWNEPDAGFLNVTSGGLDNVTYALEYVKMFNQTYNQVKAVYPNIKVVGASSTNKGYVNYINTYLSNLSSRVEGITDHMYWRASPNGIVQTLLRDSNNLSLVCSSYSANCSMIYANEWNLNIDDGTSYTPFHYMGTSTNYIDMLNNYPTNSSLMLYTWFSSDNFSIFNVTSNTPYLYSPYYVTSNFTRYAPSGGTVYNSSTDYSPILVVNTKIGSTNNLIITNTENNQQNITINGLSANELLIDVNTGTLYNADSSGSLAYGVLDNYSVTSLTTPILNLTEDALYKYNYLGELLGTGQEINVSADTTNDTTRSIHIASSVNTTNTVIIITDINCDAVDNVKLTPNGESSYNPSYTCNSSADTLTVYGNNLTISSESNILDIDLDVTCNESTMQRIGYKIIGIIMGLLIPLGVLYYMNKIGWENIGLGHIVIITISIIFGTTLYISSSSLLGICGGVAT